MNICEVWRLGHIPYQQAWDQQNALARTRGTEPGTPDRLLLLEHPPTYTLGTAGQESNLLWGPDELAARGVTVFRIDRGGDITYHGPGQLVGYPIIQLAREGGLRLNVLGYVRNLEEVIIRTLADYAITGQRIDGLTGVWVDTPQGPEKVCAIGVKINVKGVTKHGFALNLNTDLRYFDGIVPCGIHDKGVTSVARLLGHPVDETKAAQRVIGHFGAVFGCEMIET